MTDAPPPPNDQPTRPESLLRFNLGTLLISLTLLSLVLGIWRALPMPDDMRLAYAVNVIAWSLAALVAVGPSWLKYLRMKRALRARQAQLLREIAAARPEATAMKPPSHET
ncbi:MAG TPA: hypothetical protein VL096_13415 [Pirellulaceae bacterium]|nr:hypothetical protein [Pirellulaceae bacterium]